MRARHSLSPALAALAAVTIAFVAAFGLSGCGGTSSASMSYFPEPTPGRSLSSVPGARVWAVGWPELVIESTDGGATWAVRHQRKNTPVADFTDTELLDVVFAGSQRVWAVGGRLIVTTNDGGSTWASHRLSPGFYVYAAATTDAQHAWIVGARYRGENDRANGRGRAYVVATRNGGRTWTRQPVDARGQLFDVAFTDGRHGWAVGYGGAALKPVPVIVATIDGGAHWRAQDPGEWSKGTRLQGLALADTLHGCAVGKTVNYKGIILSTSDGGAHWRTEISAAEHELNGVACTDARHVWAVGDSGLIMATTNGGKTWLTYSAGQPFQVHDVSFADNTTGWAIIGGSHLLATRDGGKTWTVVSPTHQTAELRLWLGGVVCPP